jgi:hypothetical protein
LWRGSKPAIDLAKINDVLSLAWAAGAAPSWWASHRHNIWVEKQKYLLVRERTNGSSDGETVFIIVTQYFGGDGGGNWQSKKIICSKHNQEKYAINNEKHDTKKKYAGEIQKKKYRTKKYKTNVSQIMKI